MTMRRISLLLVGVVVAVMLSMGTALAHSSNNHTVCHVRSGAKDVTHYNLTHREAIRELNRHPKDYWGECKRGGHGFDIGRTAAGPFR